MLQKVMLGSMGVLPAVQQAAKPLEQEKDLNKAEHMKVSDLPIYECGDKPEEKDKKPKEMSNMQAALLAPVRMVREKAEIAWSHTSSLTSSIHDNYSELMDKTDWMVQYLREEENKEQRYGAVAIGGVTGFILGLRGGFIRRVVYSGIGVTAMGVICFPAETSELAQTYGSSATKYINVAYNFIYGVKPGDPQMELNFPKLSMPKSMSELGELTLSIASSVKRAVLPPSAKEGDKKE